MTELELSVSHIEAQIEVGIAPQQLLENYRYRRIGWELPDLTLQRSKYAFRMLFRDRLDFRSLQRFFERRYLKSKLRACQIRSWLYSRSHA